MSDYQMGSIESQFADLIWDNEPLSSAQLVKMAEERFSWKKSTTYTVLHRLCEKGIFRNDHGTVTSLISRDEFYSARSRSFVDDTFAGSLPAFLAAFTSQKRLDPDEVEQLRKMIREYDESEDSSK